MILHAAIGLMLFVYLLFPRESSQWLAAHLRSHPGSFCETAHGAPRFRLNRGQCGEAPGRRTSDAQPDDLWTGLRAVLAQRATR